MNLSEPFIRRPVMTAVLTVSAILFGVLSYRQLPVNDLPVVDYPVIQVSVGYPGASPETMANNVVTPLERQFMQINGLEIVTSKSNLGHASLTLQFALDKNIDGAATDVQTAINQATGNLPLDLPSPPTFVKNNPNDQPIIYLALLSDTIPEGQLYDYASTQVGQRISILQGVSRVNIFGTKSAVRIKANPWAMAARGITIDDLSNAIKNGTSYTGAGQFDGVGGTTILNPRGQLEDAEDYNKLIVGTSNGAAVYLRDVAKAVNSLQDERINHRFWLRGYHVPASAIVVAVNRQAGANVVEVSSRVREIIPMIEAGLPGSIKLQLIHDRSRTIADSIEDVQRTLIIAFVLVVIVIFLFLGRVTDTLIPAVALPLSILLTFIAMKILGYSLDNLSLMALTLGIGFLVDDAIVFLENTVRRMELGEDVLTATINGAKEISFTILSMTISLAAVFIPLVFMSGLIGRIFREFAITIVVAILASGLVSLTLTPLMCARLLGDRADRAKRSWFERLIGWFEHKVLRVYGVTLSWFLRHRWISALLWIVCMVGTIWLFVVVPKAFLPVGDSGLMFGLMIGREGSSPTQMYALQERVEKVLQANPDVALCVTITGLGAFMSSNQGMLLVFLRPAETRAPISMVAGPLMGTLNSIPGVLAFLRPIPVLEISTSATSQNQGQYAYTVSGVNPQEVYDTATKLMGEIAKYPGLATLSSDFFNNTPSVDIAIQREQARACGVSESRILTLLRNAYSQNYLYLIKKPQDQYQVILEVDDRSRSEPGDLSSLYIRSDDGKSVVPLKALISWKTSIGPQAVNHLNQFTSVSIFFNLKPGVPVGDATDFVERAAKKTVPLTVRGSLMGEALTFQQTMANLTILMFLAVFVMYVILAILYESYLHPITVLSSLPIALVGGLLTLHLTGQVASLYAFVGMFMLMGIVKKNGIMIVDFALQRSAAGESAERAVHQASLDRFRPIMMTTVAAIAGAVPIAIGYGADGSSRQPLGLVIVGGLVVSQLITLYVTPVIYLYMEDFQKHVLDRTSFFRSTRAPHKG